MSEYIFEINDAIFDEKTGRAVMKPHYVSELIRCRDCMHFHEGGDCPFYWESLQETDYCSYAERRGNED